MITKDKSRCNLISLYLNHYFHVFPLFLFDPLFLADCPFFLRLTSIHSMSSSSVSVSMILLVWELLAIRLLAILDEFRPIPKRKSPVLQEFSGKQWLNKFDTHPYTFLNAEQNEWQLLIWCSLGKLFPLIFSMCLIRKYQH